MAFFFFFFLAPFLFTHLSHSATVIVDGVSQWKNPHLHIGDSVIFYHKNRYNLYIFKSQEAFALCNFTKATLLTNPKSSSYTWHTSRPGNFYFAFKNGANGGCSEGEKFAVKVSAVAGPEPAAEPRPVSGGVVASSPAFPWPFQPRESVSPSPAPALSLAVGAPAAAPDRGGIPFINSNPAVPLPTGEVDSATIRPLPTSSGFQHFNQVVGFGGVAQRALSCCVILVMMMV